MNPIPIPELTPHLKQLRLSGILDSLEARNRQAIDSKLAYTEFLALLIQDEIARRDQKKFTMRLRRASFRTTKTLDQFSRIPLLVIDDFGLKPLCPPADEDLHDLVAERYEQTSTIITSNLDFKEWDQAFPNNRLLASATVGRLRHNAYCLELEGPSGRHPKVVPPSGKSTLASAAKSNHS